MIDPGQDGVSHINVYSKGRTALGRFLSNFTRQRIETRDGPFESVEGYWYWLGTDHPDRDRLRGLWGFDAKRVGRELRGEEEPDAPGFKHKILVAIEKKLETRPDMMAALVRTTQPLKHYYCYGGKVIELPQFTWIIDHLEYLRRTNMETPQLIKRITLSFEPETDTTVKGDERRQDGGATDAMKLLREIEKTLPNIAGSAEYKAGYSWVINAAIEGALKWRRECAEFQSKDEAARKDAQKTPKDIWSLWEDGYYAVITTNMQVKQNEENVMGAGLAKAAAEKFTGLPLKYGQWIKKKGHGFYLNHEYRIVCVPTKIHWKDKSTIELVEKAVDMLAKLPADIKVAVPPLGCGLGSLKYSEVKPILERLPADRFVLVPPSADKSEEWSQE